MSRRWYPVFMQTLRSNSKKEKTGIVAKKCYPQNSSRASIRHTDHLKLITGVADENIFPICKEISFVRHKVGSIRPGILRIVI